MAIELPEKVKDELERFKQNISGRVKFVEKENLHLTLKFLGEVNPNNVIERLKAVKHRTFTMRLKGVGFFPNERFIRVIWVGVDLGRDKVKRLYDDISAVLGDGEEFVPHVTLARVKGRVKVLNRDFTSSEFEVKGFSLFKSTLTPKGPVYEKIHSF